MSYISYGGRCEVGIEGEVADSDMWTFWKEININNVRTAYTELVQF